MTENFMKDRDMKDWKPHLYKCGECEQELSSKYPGHFHQCDCGKSFVDETRHYTRCGGALVSLQEETKDD